MRHEPRHAEHRAPWSFDRANRHRRPRASREGKPSAPEAEELAHRLRRRIQTYRRVRTHGPEQVLAEWVNERDIDLRIKSGDPVAVVDALADAAEGIDDARRNLEIEMGIDTGDVRGEAG